jgi:hypothetical protein
MCASWLRLTKGFPGSRYSATCLRGTLVQHARKQRCAERRALNAPSLPSQIDFIPLERAYEESAYIIMTDLLETIVGSSPVTRKHGALLSAIAHKTVLHDIALVTTRDHFVPMPHRILDRGGEVISHNFEEWMRDKLDRHHGDHVAVWQVYKGAGYVMTEREPVMRYLVHDRGGDQTNFVQLKVFEEHEFTARHLFNTSAYGQPFSADSMLEGGAAGDVVGRRKIGNGWYRFRSAIDMAEFVPEAARLYQAERERQGEQVIEISSPRTNEVTRTTFAELYPEHSKYPWKGTRFFQDWEESSAGRLGARVCRHWVFDTSDYLHPRSGRDMSYVPQWGFNRPLAKIDCPGKNIYDLFGKLQKLDQRIGVPFSWYFYMLHGNRVEFWAGERMINAA